ncbi:hypothetical protein ACFJGV_05160 [Cnuibacter sp. UC19_7]|uniref:hypothetical protein n=1 Tax=Cnuibacter sp. UC19_7 TaxID=3350166 RepID=UPI00366DF230
MKDPVAQETPGGNVVATPLKGLIFVLFWLIAIALWIIAPNIQWAELGAFLIDTGIVFASVGFAVTAVTWPRPLRNTLVFGVLAIAAFAVGDFLDITALSYTLRILVPFVALLAALYGAINKVKIFAAA